MEMDLVIFDHDKKGSGEESARALLSPSYSSIGDDFGDPQVLPRVGEQYQTEIPPLIPEYDRLQLIDGRTDMADVPYTFLWGSPIPVMWKNDDVENVNGIVEFENSEESQITEIYNYSPPNSESLAIAWSEGKEIVGVDNMDVDIVIAQESQITLAQAEKGCCPIPWSLDKSWSDIERASFVLSLYIFGKNLNLVKRFLKTKQMGDILSFYYGKFYRSQEYQRWSECRKTKSRKCIQRQKIFTGGRQQELFSRLFACVSEECQKKVLEVSKKYGDGKMPFEEYVFTLKDTVGIDILVEAIGIGKGKNDLTGISVEPVKSNHAIRARHEVPIGKACSTLTYGDIIKFLNGDIRLSKARSSDLFWEAVWPRLLARGWHSEQRKDLGVTSLKQSLVFLIPGVKKFSRRKLVKGNHYFDSVSDVLNKVASDPEIIELKIEEAKGSVHKEENGSHQPIEQDPEGLSSQQRHCYLKPRDSNSSRGDLMRFTVVDTSSVCGEGGSKVVELKSLPTEATTSISTRCSTSNYTEQDSSEESEDEAVEETKVSTSNLSMGMPNGIDLNIVAADNHDSQSTSLRTDKQKRKKSMGYQSQKVKSGKLNYPAPATKDPVLTACDHRESSHSIDNLVRDSKQDEDESQCQSKLPGACEHMDFHAGSSQNLSSVSSAKCISAENCLCAELSSESHQPRTLIDLNIPYVSPDSAAAEPTTRDNSDANKPSLPPETSQQLETPKHPDEPVMNGRRQSSRNRPLTTKALEALEWGFFPTKKKRKGPEASSSTISRSSQRVRFRTNVTPSNDTAGNDITDLTIEESSNGADSSNTNVDIES